MKRYKFIALAVLFASSMLLTSCEWLFEDDNPVNNPVVEPAIAGSTIGLNSSESQPQSNAQ